MLGEGERLRQIAPLLSDWPWCSRLKRPILITLNSTQQVCLTSIVKVYSWKYMFTLTALTCKPPKPQLLHKFAFRCWVCRITRAAREPIPTLLESILKGVSFNYTSYKRSIRHEARPIYIFKGKGSRFLLAVVTMVAQYQLEGTMEGLYG